MNEEWIHAPDKPIVNLQLALDLVDQDADLLQMVVDCFLAEAPQQLNSLQQALTAADAPAARIAAHQLKGGLGNVGSQPTYELAQRIETLAISDDLPTATQIFHILRVEMQRLTQFYAGHLWRKRYGV